MNRLMTVFVLVVPLASVISLPAAADDYTTQAIIDGTVGSGMQGALSINMASGDSNLQSNTRAIATSPTGYSTTKASTTQTINGGSVTAPDSAIAKINGAAFSNATGVIGINQAAGAANLQGNNLAIAIGADAEVSADTLASQNVADNPPTVTPAAGQQRETTVGPCAFHGVRGIVQVNQSAGVQNATSNNFSMSIHLGALQ